MPIPEAVKPILDNYMAAMEKELPGLMTGFYLHGSIALDAFNDALSDIDFITMTSRKCSESDVARLTAVHQQIKQKYPKPPLQGSYLQAADLGKFEIEPQPYYSDDVLHRSGRHDINSVTWWLLKNRGVTVMGTDARNLMYSVDWDKLVSDMHDNLNTYWVKFTRQRVLWLLSDYGVQWVVLGVLRQYYTFIENDITSKTGAGEYALTHLPQRWHKLVQEALNIRAGKGRSLYSNQLVRAVEAYRFLKFILQECNK